MELLAPAGTMGAFRAALDAGADAVYVGAPGLNARALSREFTFKEIAAMVQLAREEGKRLYVAMNSLVKEDEIYHLLDSLSMFEQIKPDALIIQDLGLFHLARKYFPELSLHASTLMSVHNQAAADFLYRIGYDRVVLARELSITDIRSIASGSKAHLEVFIHGAMCFSYSGLCLFSSLHGGKSSLRGRCVQPCRRQFQAGRAGGNKKGRRQNQGGFFFSMNDLTGIDYLKELDKAGVVSLKIEGRLKPVEYVRNTVRAYRLSLDGLYAEESTRTEILREAQKLLSRSMGRKSGSGFFDLSSRNLINPQHSGSAGTFVGKAQPVNKAGQPGRGKGSLFGVRLKRGVRVGDRLRYQNEKDDIRESFTLKNIYLGRQTVDQAHPGQSVVVHIPGVEGGRKGKPQSGLLFQVDTIKGRKSEGRWEPLSRLKIRSFSPDRGRVQEIAAHICCPDGRKGGGKEERGSRGGRSQGRSTSTIKQKPRWWIRMHHLPPAKQRYPVSPEKICISVCSRNMELIQQLGRQSVELYPNLVWALPPVIHQSDLTVYRSAVDFLMETGFMAFQVGHISQLDFFRQLPRVLAEQLAVYADYTVNGLNANTIACVKTLGLKGMLFSVETDRTTMQRAMTAWDRQQQVNDGDMHSFEVGMYVYGKLPLFTARADAPHLRINQNIISPKNEAYTVEQTDQLTLVRSRIPLVLLPHVTEMMRSGISYFVLDISNGHLKKELPEVAAWLHGRQDVHGALQGNYDMGLA